MAENTKKWEEIARRYRTYIKLEKRLADNTVESYMRDLGQFAHFILRFYDVAPRRVEAVMIERYIGWLYDRGKEKTSQARILSGIRSFFNYLLLTDAIAALGEREKRILALRYYDGKTQMEVAGEIGISQAQVSRLEKHALKNMRSYLRT